METITVTLTYFKRSGKYYSQGTINLPETFSLQRPWEIYQEIDRLQKTGRLPELIEGCGGEFTIYVDIPDGVPAIVDQRPMPRDLSAQHQTMLELLDYPNPEGIDIDEARWRDFARAALGKATHETLLTGWNRKRAAATA